MKHNEKNKAELPSNDQVKKYQEMAEANKQSLGSLYDELKDQTDIARDYSVDFTMSEKAKLGIT